MRITKKNLTRGITAVVVTLFVAEWFTIGAVKNIWNARQTEESCACLAGTAMNFSSWLTVGIAGVFAVGFIAALVYLLATYLRTRRMALELKKQEQSSLAGVGFYLQDGDCCGAFTFGFIFPKIAVCRHCVKLLPSTEISAMLIHEEYHVQRRDPLRFLILELLQRMYFFVPVLRALISAYRTAAEIAADKTVPDRENLGRALLHVTYTPEALDGRAAFASAIYERIERIINPQWEMKLVIPKSFVFLSGAMLVSMALLLSRPEAPKSNLSTCAGAAVRSCANPPTYGAASLMPSQF
ncbi:M56 family metallopeptidase [Candidatus Uhrbacteria bacterium]|nr:M56 family metallopeptidase [Candidatus Uhrbacteria bacterium]